MSATPLQGRSVVVTRATAQASKLRRALEELGAAVIPLPVIEIAEPIDGGTALATALGALERYDWLVLTSANGVERVAAILGDRRVASTRIAAIGPGTAEALGRHGLEPDLLPRRFVAEGLVEVFPAPPERGGSVLVAQAAGARPVLVEGLQSAGWEVSAVEAYRTRHPDLDAGLAERARRADVVTFTSASTVEGYVSAVGLDPTPRLVVCIGPVTAAAAEAAGLNVDAVAEPHTIAGLVDAVIECTKGRAD